MSLPPRYIVSAAAPLLAAVIVLPLLLMPLPAFSQDAVQIAAGKAVWDDANCAGCHGENGQGGTDPDLPHGPSLRLTKLNRNGLTQIIGCGRIGTPMPAWLNGAYTRTPCISGTAGPAPAGVTVIGAYNAGQIAALVDYLEAVFVGK